MMENADCDYLELKHIAASAIPKILMCGMGRYFMWKVVSFIWTWKLRQNLWHQVLFKTNYIENDLEDQEKLKMSSMIYIMRPKRKYLPKGIFISKNYQLWRGFQNIYLKKTLHNLNIYNDIYLVETMNVFGFTDTIHEFPFCNYLGKILF